jgi:hypothetical protein
MKFLYERDGFGIIELCRDAGSRREHRPPEKFTEGMMITGLKGTARKV